MMEFTRKKIKGQNKKVRKTWMSEEKYRIVWRCEAWGIALPAAFQATVRILLPNGSEMWDFVSSRRLFKTFKAAQEACEKHQRLWQQAAEGTGIRKLEELFGKVPSGYPLWVRPKLNRNVYGLLMDTTTRKRKDIEICDLDQDALTRISASFAGPTGAMATDPTDDDTHVSPAKEEGSSLSETDKPISPMDQEPPAPPAEEPAEAPRKRARKRTSSQSTPTKSRKRNTKSSSASAKKPSASSRKPRKPRSKS
jgi:hypothetical protein